MFSTPLSFHEPGAVHTDPMIFTLRLLAPEMSPERLPSEFIPTRTIDSPIESAPLVVKSLSQSKVPPPSAVLRPKPSIICSILSS